MHPPQHTHVKRKACFFISLLVHFIKMASQAGRFPWPAVITAIIVFWPFREGVISLCTQSCMCKNGSIFRVQFIRSSTVLCLCSTAFQLLLIFILYDLWNELSSVLGCLIGSFLWLKFESFIILMEVCAAWNLLEPSKMGPYAMCLFFALNISTGEICAFYAQFYGTRKRRGCFVCVHDLKENKHSYSPDKENYNLKKGSFICTSFHYLIIAKTLALCQSEILFFFS